MKKVVITLVALVLLIGLSGCSKQQRTAADAEQRQITVAYSQAELVNEWRLANQREMEEKAQEYGVRFITANADQDTAKQLLDVQALLAQRPDVLIVSPLESAALVPIVDMCNKAQVPLITIDRTINHEPGTGMHMTEIVQSHEEAGIYLAEEAVRLLTEKYGEPRGNVVHIQGQAGASPVIDANRGWYNYMTNYPHIKTIATEDAGFTFEGGRRVMENFLRAFGKGQIDIVRSDYSDMHLGALEAIKNSGRNELLGYILGQGGHYKAIQEVVNGNFAAETQTPPYFGDDSIWTAIKIANGESVPARQSITILVFYATKKDEAQVYLDKITAKNLPF